MKAPSLLLALAGLLAGCATPALHGIPEEERAELPDELLGEWRDAKETKLVVERTADGFCEVLARFEEADREPVELRLRVSAVELAEHWILDIALAESEVEKLGETYGTLVIPAHVFFRLQGDGNSITLAFLDPDWLNGHPQAQPVELLDDMPLVTAGSKELIELLTAAAREDAAWEGDWHLTRRP